MTNPCRLPFKPRILSAVLEKALGLDQLSAIYDARPQGCTPHEFLQYTLDAIGVSLELINGAILDELPRTGPVLIVANHPLGGLEGVAIAKVIADIRPDLKVLTNELLRRIPEMADIFIGVDVLSSDAAASNVASVKQVHKHLKNDGAVLIFPAGMVHPRLRTALLPRQLANKQGFNLPLRFGRPIPAAELRLLQSPRAITDYLRVSTDALMREPLRSTDPEYQSVADGSSAIRPHELLDTIESLKKFRLIEHEEFDVYCAPFESLGPIMEQIAIARELTFRSVGEGTGLSKDSDEFDPHYLHLFLWDKTALRIAGAYRVGLVDEIVAAHGVKGLYSRSLYKYDEAFVNQLGSAIEMGRSFIHPDYQKKPVSLNLLWRGIGRILVEKPRYHTLFGSVSISREYSDLARALIADTMLTNFKASEYDQLVRPITPHKIMNRVWTSEMIAELSNVKMLGKLIGRCDPGKAVPVLLRHYLSVNGKLVCFNIHPNFNDSLEGLIIVDARKTDAKTLSRFLGTDGYEHFMSFHKLQDTA